MFTNNLKQNYSRYLAYSSMSAVCQKAVSLISVFLIIPLVANSLNEDDFKVWMIYYAALQAIQFLDLGLGNSIISDYKYSDDPLALNEQRRSVASTFFLALALTVLLSLLYLSVTHITHLTISLFENLFILLLIFNIPFSIAAKLFIAEQKIVQYNFYLIFCQIFMVIGTYLMLKIGLYGLIILPMLIIPTFIINIIVTLLKIYDYKIRIDHFLDYPRKKYKKIIFSGLIWANTQALLFTAYGFDIFFVSIITESNFTVDFGILYRFAQVLGLSLLITNSIWPIINQKISTHQLDSARRIFFYIMFISAVIGILGAFLLVVGTDFVMLYWIGRTLDLPFKYVIIYSVWCVLFNIWCCISATSGNERLLTKYQKGIWIGVLLVVIIKTFAIMQGYPILIPMASVIGLSVTCIYVMSYFLRFTTKSVS